MFLPTIEVTVAPRPKGESYNVQVTPQLLDILGYIFEFKIITTEHLARFVTHTNKTKYLRTKLRRMWLGGLLESLELYAGTRLGMPRYYMLSKQGLRVLLEYAQYDALQVKTYPSPTRFVTSGVFKHDAHIVELASLEAMNHSDKLSISFTGEMGSMQREMRSNNTIEVLTPDYIAMYVMSGTQHLVYTEYERTNKSTAAMIRKVERYANYFGPGEGSHTTLRLIFQTPRMEESFWLNLFLNKPALLQRVRVVTTTVPILHSPHQFLEPVYASERTVDLKREGRVVAKVGGRVRLVEA